MIDKVSDVMSKAEIRIVGCRSVDRKMANWTRVRGGSVWVVVSRVVGP